jgi:pimeloyl-ACP methyl ester carboxylesterase
MHIRLCRAVALIGAVALAAPVLAGGEAGKLTLRDVGARFVGYTTEVAANGSVNVLNPMFVQYLLPARSRHDLPVVMIHGGGGQGTDWLETPDGRDGWVDYFVADGWDVYVVDRPGHGRSQSNSACGNGMVGVGNSAIISRLSTADPAVWPGGEPTLTNDAVVAWTASSATAPYCGDDIAAATISALLDEIGPAILMAHSAGGGSTFRVPELPPGLQASLPLRLPAPTRLKAALAAIRRQLSAGRRSRRYRRTSGPLIRTAAICRAITQAGSSITPSCRSCCSRRRWDSPAQMP